MNANSLEAAGRHAREGGNPVDISRVSDLGLATLLMTLTLTLLPALQPASAAEELGRLFLTPEQRAELERLRHAPPPAPAPPPIVDATLPAPVEELPQEQMLPPPPPPYVPPVTVNGVVLRSDGQGTAWVNGQNTLEGDFSQQNIRVMNPRGESVSIVTPEHLPNVRLKPGQTYDPATNTIVDVYQSGQ